jgi:hypothetical protein
MLVDGVPHIHGGGLRTGRSQQIVISPYGQNVGTHLVCIADVRANSAARHFAHQPVRGFLTVVRHLDRQHATGRQQRKQTGNQGLMLAPPREALA